MDEAKLVMLTNRLAFLMQSVKLGQGNSDVIGTETVGHNAT